MLLEEELWKTIKYPNHKDVLGLYEVSNLGRIRNKETKHILKPSLNRATGYLIISVSSSKVKQRATVSVHRIVAYNWVSNPNPSMLTSVNHKDEIKTHNFASNLEWVTPKQNSNYGHAREKLSQSLLNGDNKKKVPVIVLDEEGNIVKQCNSLHSVIRLIGRGSRGPIQNRLNVPELYPEPYYGYYFKYADDNRTIDFANPEAKGHGIESVHHNQSRDEVQNRITLVRPNLVIVSGYKSIHRKCQMKCIDCGTEFSASADGILYSGYNCPKCSREHSAKVRSRSREDVEKELLYLTEGNISVGDDYTNSHTECTLTCKNCGYKFTGVPITLLGNLKKGNSIGNGCEHCSKSRYRTISNLKRYGHPIEDVIKSLIKKNLYWNPNSIKEIYDNLPYSK